MEENEKPPARKCTNCSSDMESYGWQDFQFIQRGILSLENTLPMEVLICPNCGKMDFFAHEVTKKLLEPGKPGPEKRICHVCKHEAIGSEKCPYCGAMPKDERTHMF